jgi:carboxymethylenebutenolidase
MPEVMIGTPNGQMPAYVATPDGTGPWPGVVVIHDFAWMSHDLRNQADWLASEGYLAAAADLYYWGSRLRCLWTIMREVTAGQGRTVTDIDTARDWLSVRPDCTGRIGVLGFCMGPGSPARPSGRCVPRTRPRRGRPASGARRGPPGPRDWCAAGRSCGLG